jgi:hypothetical protein
MDGLFDLAFARLEHAERKRADFAVAWADYIAPHPWEIFLRSAGLRTYDGVIKVREPASPILSLAFSDWLSSLRAALDNGLYAWAAFRTGQNPPPDADRLQFPIASSPQEFNKQARRLKRLPPEITSSLERAQPYQSPYGHETNLLYWLHELARIDRHRALHVGLGRIVVHKIHIELPGGVTAVFDESVQPYDFIDSELIIARFKTDRAVDISRIAMIPRLEIGPEVKQWAGFRIEGRRQSLHERMIMTEIFMRNHLENMALDSGKAPPDGFRTFHPGGASVRSTWPT